MTKKFYVTYKDHLTNNDIFEAERILWFSRHEPTEEQQEELRRVLGGGDIIIVQEDRRIHDIKELVKIMSDYGCTEIVSVLPLTMMYQLVKEYGIEPIYVKMKQINSNGRTKHQFQYYNRIKNINMSKMEPTYNSELERLQQIAR